MTVAVLITDSFWAMPSARALAVPVEPRVAPRLAGFATSIAIAGERK